LLPEASKLADESLKAEIEKEIKKVIWVILGLAVWKASKSKKVASPWQPAELSISVSEFFRAISRKLTFFSN